MRNTVKALTKAYIRASAITELTWRGHTVWIQNNLAVKGRKFIGRRGVADIIGFTKYPECKFVACEIKTVNDRLSKDQIEFMADVKSSGGIALIAKQNNKGQVELIEFNPKEYE